MSEREAMQAASDVIAIIDDLRSQPAASEDDVIALVANTLDVVRVNSKCSGYREGFLACREAAAKVARGMMAAPEDDWDSSYWDQACERIALAIEALTPGER